jgi:hypothetical protein
MKRTFLFAAALAIVALPALAVEATFDRNLQFGGRAELTVNTGSGNIHITRGGAGQIHVWGRVHGGWGVGEDRVRQVAANPPIEQTGNIVRIGGHHENLRNISIDYEIQAPEDTILEAGSGSGDLKIENVGQNAKLSTGSGNIHAAGLHGAFIAGTGSGDIWIEQAGEGDVKAHTGSGSIELRNIRGALRADTGSGDIRIGGAPTQPWKISTGSGSVDLWPSNAPLTLDASTGSGSIHADRGMTTQGTSDRHHITGKINGDGPTVRVSTGSGDIRVH